MSFRALLAVGALWLASASPALAQVDSEGMGDLDAWGTRHLDAGEPEFPNTLWLGSDDRTLLDLIQAIEVRQLTQSERLLVRRIILSPTRKPVGEAAQALLGQRARLMLELGAAEAAATLAPYLEPDALGLDDEAMIVDLDLASGNEAAACAALTGPLRTGDYWIKLRAVCAVLQEDYAAAELAVEVASAQGLDDPWFLEAIFAASGDTTSRPEARFDSGLNIALSSKAGLDTQPLTLPSARPDLAVRAASRPGLASGLQVRFAELASEAGLITPEVRRDILIAHLRQPGAVAATPIEHTLKALTEPQREPAMQSGIEPLETELAEPPQGAQLLADVLDEASRVSFARFSATAHLFLPDLKTLAATSEGDTHAISFARAALAAGDVRLMREFLLAPDDPALGLPNAFYAAQLEATALLIDPAPDKSALRSGEVRLLEAASSPAQRQAAARLFANWAASGLSLGPEARTFLSAEASLGERIDPFDLLAIGAAGDEDAIGEAALLILQHTRGAPEKLNGGDLAGLIAILHDIDAADIAAGLALEASGYWKDIEQPKAARKSSRR